MGEYADMVLAGEMCQDCGNLLSSKNGLPGYCDTCGGRWSYVKSRNPAQPAPMTRTKAGTITPVKK